MCSVDANSATRMLDLLRYGAYDRALWSQSSGTLTKTADTTEYPWVRAP
jgi:hypothetical protein